MKFKKTFLIGSKAFFNKFDDYTSKDIDELIILERPFNISNKNIKMLNMKLNNKDVFLYYPITKDEFINEVFETNVPMKVGKFLVKEFAEYINMSINDLKKLEPIFNKLDDKHIYEKIIYESYIENNDFYMTDEQLNKAYNIYKKYRKTENK